jgi:hypothetical protein
MSHHVTNNSHNRNLKSPVSSQKPNLIGEKKWWKVGGKKTTRALMLKNESESESDAWTVKRIAHLSSLRHAFGAGVAIPCRDY